MAGRRIHHSGNRARSARQRSQLRQAQLISARKRKRNKRVLVGLAAGVAVAGIGAASYKAGAPKVRQLKHNIAMSPYHKGGTEIHNERKLYSKEIQSKNRKIRELRRRANVAAANKARRHTPEQRAEAKAKRDAYQAAYNAKRKERYQRKESVANGMRKRKPRAKETKPRKPYVRRKKPDDG